MPFSNKDLLVSVLPKLGIDAAQIAKLCLLRTFICRQPTFCFHATCIRIGSLCAGCSLFITEITGGGCQVLRSCGPGGSACDPTIFCAGSDPFVIEDLEDLVTLRGELQSTLEQLNQIEKSGLPSSIQTKAQADEIEGNLTAALEHVRAQRKKIK